MLHHIPLSCDSCLNNRNLFKGLLRTTVENMFSIDDLVFLVTYFPSVLYFVTIRSIS